MAPAACKLRLALALVPSGLVSDLDYWALLFSSAFPLLMWAVIWLEVVCPHCSFTEILVLCEVSLSLSSLHPGDLYPFTRKPLFIIVDSSNSVAYKVRLWKAAACTVGYSVNSTLAYSFYQVILSTFVFSLSFFLFSFFSFFFWGCAC